MRLSRLEKTLLKASWRSSWVASWDMYSLKDPKDTLESTMRNRSSGRRMTASSITGFPFTLYAFCKKNSFPSVQLSISNTRFSNISPQFPCILILPSSARVTSWVALRICCSSAIKLPNCSRNITSVLLFFLFKSFTSLLNVSICSLNGFMTLERAVLVLRLESYSPHSSDRCDTVSFVFFQTPPRPF